MNDLIPIQRTIGYFQTDVTLAYGQAVAVFLQKQEQDAQEACRQLQESLNKVLDEANALLRAIPVF